MLDNIVARAMLYWEGGDDVAPRAELGAHFNGLFKIGNDYFTGGELFYHNSDPGAGFVSGYIPGLNLKDIQEFIDSNIEDLMPIPLRSLEGKNLLNLNRYEDIINTSKKGGILMYFRVTNPLPGKRGEEKDDPLFEGGIIGGAQGFTFSGIRMHSVKDYRNIYKFSYGGQPIKPYEIFIYSEDSKIEDIGKYKTVGAGFRRIF